MPCNASYARFIFGKFFTSTIILYVLLFAQKVLFLQKVGVTVGEVFLYYILRVEVIEIQISLQITNRFGKRKGISNSILAMGRNPAGNRVRPSQLFLSPHSGAAQHGPAEAGMPSP
jgi:hypothetical protein